MKGLQRIPSERMLANTYARLLHDALVPLSMIVRAALWSRFDPRLGEIVIAYLEKHWQEISPVALNRAMRGTPWPATLGVLLGQIEPPADQALFRNWRQCATSGITRAANEQYFIGLYAFAGDQARQQAIAALKPYRRLGYLAADLMARPKEGADKTRLEKTARRLLLKQLIRKRTSVTVEDYRRALNFYISKRQAQRDLAAHDELSGRGRTQRRVYLAKTQNPADTKARKA